MNPDPIIVKRVQLTLSASVTVRVLLRTLHSEPCACADWIALLPNELRLLPVDNVYAEPGSVGTYQHEIITPQVAAFLALSAKAKTQAAKEIIAAQRVLEIRP